MNLEQRLNAFVQLGKVLKAIGESKSWPGFDLGVGKTEYEALEEVVKYAHHHNGWFTESSVRTAFKAWGSLLVKGNIEKWIDPYDLKNEKKERRIGIVMAGNIPLVGFHDLLSVVISGNAAVVKLSTDDNLLMSSVIAMLKTIEPGMNNLIEVKESKLEEIDAVIATGSNNTARYFEYYFGDKPHIIRKNRTSVAVLEGDESDEQLYALGADIFTYFGLGCRNVSKIFIPRHYNLDRFFEGIYEHRQVIEHHKYANNYDYNKTVWLMNREKLLDNGFLLLKEVDKTLTSPLASIFYARYTDKARVEKELSDGADQIQCVLGIDHIPFGYSQKPELWDYADGVDTLKFLTALR